MSSDKRSISIFAAFLLVLIRSALGTCVWGICGNKVTNIGALSCGSGYTFSGESRDCGSETCVFGLCTYTDHEHKCCPDNSCPWWDVTCNWDSISDYFETSSDNIKNAWSAMSHALQDKLTTEVKFQTLTDAELLSLDTELLSELKSVKGMTLHQLQVVATKVHGMSGDHLKHFLDDLNATTLKNGISSLAASAGSWTAEQVKKFTDKLSSSALWGQAASWTKSNIDSLGKMISEVELATLMSLANEALANATNLIELTSAQLGGLGQKMFDMDVSHLTSMIERVSPSKLADSMLSLTGIDYAWAENQTSSFITKLSDPAAWGQMSTWTSATLNKLGSMLPSVSQELISLLDDTALANAPNLIKFGVEHLGNIAPKVFTFGTSLLTNVLNGLNVSVLCDGLSRITDDYVWTPEQGSVFQSKVLSPDTCGSAVSWTTEQIGSLGSVLTRLDLDKIGNFSNAALAHASSLAQLAPNKITALTDKFGSMATDHFASMLDGLDFEGLHASMLAQCNIQCPHEEDQAFLENPNVSSAAAALEAYAQRVRKKSSDAALVYANSFCSGGAAETGSHAMALYAELQAQSAPCNVSVARDNVARKTFAQWSNSQSGALINRLTDGHAFGILSHWTDSQMTAFCHQFARFQPSQIAEMTASTLISKALESGKDLALRYAFGSWAPVADYAISAAAEHITPDQRSAFASKFKQGLGTVANWGCNQVASLQTMAAGLEAADLAAIPLQAVKGLKANAITAMRSVQVQGFTPEQMTSMVADVRKRMNGDLLEGLSNDQIVAAVCGNLTFSKTSLCPPAVVDFSLRFPSSPNMQAVIKTFADSVPGVDESDVQVLMMVNESDLPATPGTRRLSGAGTEVALRIGVQDPSQKAAATSATRSAAESLTTGNLVGDIVSHDIDPEVRTTTTTLQASQGGRSATVATTSGAHTRLGNGLQVVFLCLLSCTCAMHC